MVVEVELRRCVSVWQAVHSVMRFSSESSGPRRRDCPLYSSWSGWSLCRASCRPQGKSNPGHNCFRHGILARKIVLENKVERMEFERLFQRCRDDFRPQGLLGKFFVEEIAILFWKLRITLGFETEELSNRQQDARDQMGDIFRAISNFPSAPPIFRLIKAGTASGSSFGLCWQGCDQFKWLAASNDLPGPGIEGSSGIGKPQQSESLAPWEKQ